MNIWLSFVRHGKMPLQPLHVHLYLVKPVNKLDMNLHAAL